MLGLLTSLFVFLAPTFPLILLVGIFIIVDTCLGVYVAYKLKNQVTSRKLARVITKVIIYITAILLIFGLDTHILSIFIETDLLVTKVGAGVLCFIEGFSIDESIRKINNDKGVAYYVKKTFESVKKLKNGFNSMVND